MLRSLEDEIGKAKKKEIHKSTEGYFPRLLLFTSRFCPNAVTGTAPFLSLKMGTDGSAPCGMTCHPNA
jgi:hypothetical protein